MRGWVRYAIPASGLTALVVAVGWLTLGADAQRGVFLAAGIALPLQLAIFALLRAQRTGSMGFLAVWVGSTLLRLMAVGGLAWWVVGRQDVDPMWALLTLAGLLFVLLMLELVELRHTGIGLNEGSDRT
ncbi:MAG: hypothetical protein EA351_08915 [Gemmatimonadales bacterium]|nr:MAG: hypothetical protein EA351_08915 [Gemmatimonadales bacterium]